MKDLFLLRPDIAFLNHGSFGACPRVVFEEYQRWQLELERQPVEFLGRRFRDLLRGAREALAGYVGARAEDVVFVTNATTGVNTVAKSLDLQPGDEVLTTDHEYGAVERTWRWVCERTGASYVPVALKPPFEDPDEVIEKLWAAVTPRTRVLAISHITSPTAVTFPIGPLMKKARERGILTVVDGAHAPGQIPLDLQALGVDFYSGNCHKWLNAPKGVGFLYARKEVQALVQPLVVSWGWQANARWTAETPFITANEWEGTRDISAALAVPAAIRFMAEHDWLNVQRECHELVRDARAGLCEITGTRPLVADSPDWFQQMSSIPLRPCDGQEVKRRLYDDYGVEVPVFDWNGQDLLRVSVQAYNTREDLDRLLAGLRALLR